MKSEIPLHDAVHIIRQCTGVLLEGRYLEPHLLEIEDDYSNEWMTLQWEEVYCDEELDVVVAFTEGDNQRVLLEGSTLTLVNSDGDEEELTLLREWEPEM